MTSLIKVRFYGSNNIPRGREYTYYTPEPVEIEDLVEINTMDGVTKALVTQIDVPEVEIEPFKDEVKTVIGKAKAGKETINGK